MSRKAEDAGGLALAKDDNAARRKIDRKDNPIFRLVDYIALIRLQLLILSEHDSQIKK